MRKNNSSSQLNSSLANRYGLPIKENTSLGSMGLNPNLNIEDEYIENLLKQIHLMNMEIKLMKEKQAQSSGNALWGIVNRTNQPMVSNIVESSQKYQGMRKQQDAIVYKLEKDIARLENDQGALQSELDFLEQKKAEIRDKRGGWQSDCQSKHSQLDDKIGSHGAKLRSLLEELEKEQKKNKELTEEMGKSVFQEESERAKAEKENLQIKNDELIEEMMEKDIIEQISRIKAVTETLRKEFEEDQEYITASRDNKTLRQKAAGVQKDITGANFEILQLNESIKMAQFEREKEIMERKRLTEEYQKKKSMLGEILMMNLLRKDKEALHRKNNSADIAKADEQTIKLEKRLEELKKKLLKNEEANCIISNEVTGFQRQIAELKEKNQRLNAKLAQYQIDSELVKSRGEMLGMEDQYEKSLKEETNAYLDLFELERELQYLRGRKQLLTRSIQVNDVLNGLNIEDLQRMVQKNNDLNSTVATLMGKWDEIKNFSRM